VEKKGGIKMQLSPTPHTKEEAYGVMIGLALILILIVLVYLGYI